MTKEQILKSIETYRELFNSISSNKALPNEMILNKYFLFKDGNWAKNNETFKELPTELGHYYESKKD